MTNFRILFIKNWVVSRCSEHMSSLGPKWFAFQQSKFCFFVFSVHFLLLHTWADTDFWTFSQFTVSHLQTVMSVTTPILTHEEMTKRNRIFLGYWCWQEWRLTLFHSLSSQNMSVFIFCLHHLWLTSFLYKWALWPSGWHPQVSYVKLVSLCGDKSIPLTSRTGRQHRPTLCSC